MSVDRLMSSRGYPCDTKRSIWLYILAQIAGGGAMAMALSYPRWAWLAWVSLLPLLISIRFHTPFKAMLHGAAWGASLWAVMLLSTVAEHTATLGVGLYAIVAISFYTWLGALATRYVGFHPLVLGVSWMFVELALSPLGWHDRVMADVYASSGWLSLISHSLGCVFVGFVVAFITASLVCAAVSVCAPASKRRQPSHSATTIVQCLRGDSVLQQILELVEADPRAPPTEYIINIERSSLRT